MKHIEVINKIIEAEQQAQQLAGEARDKQLRLDEDLQKDTDRLREGYMEQARKRIALVREREEKQTAEKIAALNAVQKLDMDNMEHLYRSHKEEWIDELFDRIIAE